jgi:hypothetical protein
MGNHFYGSYHWDFHPVEDRIKLLDALEVFCDGSVNLFIETISPTLLHRFRFWRMRPCYKTHLIPDTLSPRPSIFHIALTASNLTNLKDIVRRDGMSEKSIAHIKGYSEDRGLFWFHGFCDAGDRTFSCSHHVNETLIGMLEEKLGLKAEKKFGELQSDRQRREELKRILDAMERYRESELGDSPDPPKTDH